jgi:hypothetical protein
MSSLSEVLSIYGQFDAMVHSQFTTLIRVFHTDSDGECHLSLCLFLAEHGTVA